MEGLVESVTNLEPLDQSDWLVEMNWTCSKKIIHCLVCLYLDALCHL